MTSFPVNVSRLNKFINRYSATTEIYTYSVEIRVLYS